MANNLYTATSAPAAGSFGRSATLRAEHAALEAGFEKLKRHYVVFSFPDLNTAEVQYMPALELGVISAVWLVIDENNATANTVITLSIAGTPVVMPTLQALTAAVAGTATSVTPTDDHTVSSRSSVLAVTTNGGGSSVMPGRVIVEIERS